MKHKVSNVYLNFSGMGMLEVFQMQMLFLKALNLIDLSWGWVLSPMIVWFVGRYILELFGNLIDGQEIEGVDIKEVIEEEKKKRIDKDKTE